VFTINPNIGENSVYAIELLTVALIDGIDKRLECRIDEYAGAAGHVLLRFKSGGSLLASMGHGCELLKVKTSEEQLLKVVMEEYGSSMV
jgi:hypothetical protein